MLTFVHGLAAAPARRRELKFIGCPALQRHNQALQPAAARPRAAVARHNYKLAPLQGVDAVVSLHVQHCHCHWHCHKNPQLPLPLALAHAIDPAADAYR